MWLVGLVVCGLVVGSVFIGRAIASSGPVDPAENAKRAFVHTRIAPVGEARPGELAKVCAAIHPDSRAVLSPLSGKPCVSWMVTVWRWSGGSQHMVLERIGACSEFIVEDESGRATVEVGPLPVMFGTREMRFFDGEWGRHRERVEAFLQDAGIDYQGDGRNYELFEKRIDCSHPVTVLGLTRRELDRDGRATHAGYREAPMRVVLGPLGRGVVLSDEAATVIEPVT
jgi:hypothetical protein